MLDLGRNIVKMTMHRNPKNPWAQPHPFYGHGGVLRSIKNNSSYREPINLFII